MDELDKIIKENRQLFDSAEPSQGHFNRFEQALISQNATKSRSIVWSQLLKVASIAILVILSGLYVTEHFILNNNSESVIATNENREFNDAQQYYMHQVNQSIVQIEQMEGFMNAEQKQMLADEMTEMDEMYKRLIKDYNAMPNDDRIIQAMLNHYQMKMDILNRITNDLKNVQQLKTQNYESTEL